MRPIYSYFQTAIRSDQLDVGRSNRGLPAVVSSALARAEDHSPSCVNPGRQRSTTPQRSFHKRPFLLSLSQIEQEFGNNGLKPYLLDCFQTDTPGVGRTYTDIAAALRLAREMYGNAVAGSLSKFGAAGSVKIMKHRDITPPVGDPISVPNVRILLYSDGQHNPETEGPLVNPFEDVYPSPLMTAFLGDESKDTESRQGADEMKALANRCITHQKVGYFLINNPSKDAVLRNLFRMASGASGFCPQCLRGYIGSLEGKEDEWPWERGEKA